LPGGRSFWGSHVPRLQERSMTSEREQQALEHLRRYLELAVTLAD
jgi:hypothetical protein